MGEYHFTSDAVVNPPRIYFDLAGLKPPSSVHRGMQIIPVGDHLLKQIRVAEVVPGTTRIVLDVLSSVDIVSSQLVNPDRLIIEIRPKDTPPVITQSLRHSLTGAQRVNLSSPFETDKDLPPPVIRPVVASVEKPVLSLSIRRRFYRHNHATASDDNSHTDESTARRHGRSSQTARFR